MMGKGFTIEFKGLDDLLKRVAEQPDNVKKEASDIIKTESLQIEKTAKALAPVDTGYMRNHIAAEQTGPLSADITSLAKYSVYNEFGTRKMIAQPFMRPAMLEEQPFIYQKLNNLLKKGLL